MYVSHVLPTLLVVRVFHEYMCDVCDVGGLIISLDCNSNVSGCPVMVVLMVDTLRVHMLHRACEQVV